MLVSVQEKIAVSSDNTARRAYTVEEVFEHIDKKLIKAFGKDFEEKLNQEKAKVMAGGLIL